ITGEVELYVANASGSLVRSHKVVGPFPALIHDFAFTEDFIAIPFCPVTVSIERMRAGGPPIAWEPDKGVHIGILRRNDRDEVRWFSAEARMAWHVMNAFSDGNRVTVDVCEQEQSVFTFADGSATDPKRTTQLLARWTLDWDKPGILEIESLSVERCEYPRIDERRAGLKYRHGYVACHGGPGSNDLFHRGLAHFDHETRAMKIFSAGPRQAVAEPVFAPRGHREGEG